ncbi:MAG: UDP-N-acetylenolpyruvoylglucosamine reductase [Planctomycetaceae bacterium]|nr:UDP-N-acetylenolpyruvoylglucosamine reductase [Planctomycetaceae bacterium]
MTSLADFSEITRRDEPLAPYTWMKIGGPAQFLIQPRTPEELTQVVKTSDQVEAPLKLLGGGSNLLVRDAGVGGVVLRIYGEPFAKVEVQGDLVRAGAGAMLTTVISHTVNAGLAGMETLVGIPGTVGGALHGNAGGRIGDIGQFVESVTALTMTGDVVTRTKDELTFGYRESSLDDLIILEATFRLQSDDPDEITRHMRKLWISKKATQPYSFQSAGCVFKNPRGMSAGLLIDQAGLRGTRIGNAEISDRHANFIVSHPGASSADVQRLIDLARSKVAEQFGVDLELEIEVW